ncbi:DNA primase [Candidatus Latescibacterota bacterium]
MYDDFSAFKEELKTRIEIVDVIGEFLELKKRSSNYVGLCPFHTEKTPSFSVNRSGQFYHCFGCGKGGDVIGFLMDITGMSFIEAIEQLSERVGLEVPKKQKINHAARDQKELLGIANLSAAEYFHKTLYAENGKTAMDYLTGRGLTPESIKAFRLGYAPTDPSGLIDFAKNKQVSISALEAAGIILSGMYGNPPRNRFGDRVIFPIFDQTMRVIGFGGRLLKGEGAKYINSSESIIYHKGRVLFGIPQAKESIKRTRKAVVVEGYMDVISLHQAGIKNVIAASGTSFTVDQGRIIARMARNVTLLFDGDPAGLSAAARGADNLLATDLEITVAVLPEGQDPDSFVSEHGADALGEYLENPPDLWDFKLKVFGREAPTTQDRIKLAGEVADSISLITDEIKRDIYISELSSKIGVDINSMRKAVYGRIRRRVYRRDSGDSERTPVGTEHERMLMASIISYPELARHFMEEAGSKIFPNPVMKTIADELFHRIVEGLEISPSALISGLADSQSQELVASIAMISLDKTTAAKNIEDSIRRFKEREIRAEIADINRLKEAVTDEKKKTKYIKRQKELQTRLKELTEKS